MADGDLTIADNALPACSVRIDVGQSHAGSGFFVAPGVVVTCYHVLKLEQLSSAEAGLQISVYSQRGGPYPVLDIRETSETEEDDLAVLRVEAPEDHPCALLDTGLKSRDELHTFGYSQRNPTGAPTNLRSEGWMANETRLKLSEGQVEPGMSGSPVLNLRTGAVCGIIKRTRDKAQSLGGYAIPVRLLFVLSPQLESLNVRHHDSRKDEWFNLLPADQRRLLLAQRSAARIGGPPGTVFVISVDQKELDWEVGGTVYHRSSDDGSWTSGPPLESHRVDLNSVRALVARLFRDWASREWTVHGRVAPGEQIRLLGEILSKPLLRDAIEMGMDELLPSEDQDWLEVALHFADVGDDDFKEFVELPWEHLYMPQKQTRSDAYLARHRRIAFVRTLLPEPETHPPPATTLSTLVVAVKPLRPLDSSAEAAMLSMSVPLVVNELQAVAARLPELMDVKVLEAPGLEGLSGEVEGYDVVHYVGFGHFKDGSDYLALGETAQEGVEYVGASDFAGIVEDSTPPLVVLQLCRGSETVPADLSAFAPPLLMKGCRAVVPYQYPVTAELTNCFNEAFYTALAGGTSVEMAAQTARKKVWNKEQGSRAFLSPALFLRAPGGLQLVSERRKTALRPRIGALSSHA